MRTPERRPRETLALLTCVRDEVCLITASSFGKPPNLPTLAR